MDKYTYLWPDDRSKLKKGDIVKYISIDYKTNNSKIKTGILLSANINKICIKGLSSNKVWYVKFTNNYIFYFRPYFDLTQLIE